MKKILVILIASGICLFNKSVWAQNCAESNAQEYIQNSDMKILFRNGGDMFWDGDIQAQYAVPYVYNSNNQAHSMFAAATWMGALDPGGQVLLSAQTYRARGNDYWAGPIDEATGMVYDCAGFDHIWKVQRWAIEQHIADYNDNGIIDGPVNPSILQWPGRNNPDFLAQMGFPLPANQDLAPFFDANNNGIYDPMGGDYPVFEDGNPNAIAEEILWSVFNDQGGLQTQSRGLALNVEVQQTAYLFSCSNDPLLNKTLFVKHKVINRNPLKLYDYYYGVWLDFDMGCGEDDYMGTIPSKNTIYSYNADNDDDNPCAVTGEAGYGTNPPVQAVTILNHDLAHSIYYVGTQGSDPVSQNVYYRLLTGKFMDGTPLTHGGNGYNSNDPNAIPVNYAFPDNPNDAAGWSMYTENLWGFDQRTVGSIYKDSLLPGEIFTVDLAYSYHRDPDSNHLQNVNLMEQQIDLVQQYYDNNFSMACTQSVFCTSNCVYPGDANNNGVDNDFDILEMGLKYGGAAVARTQIGDHWMPHMPPTPITNAYVDANGDNIIDTLDLIANKENWQKTHSLYTGAVEGFNTVGTDLFFERYYSTSMPISLAADTIVPLRGYAVLDVNFGDAVQNITDLHGVTFRVNYDEAVLNLNLQATASSPVFGLGYTNLDNGWLDDDGAPVHARMTSEDGRIHYVGTRLNQVNYTGGGNLGRLIFRVDADAPVNAGTMSTQVCFEDFKAIRADGTTISIGAECATILYRDTNYTSIQKIERAAPAISIYPNPTNYQLNIDLGTEQNVSLQLFNVLGEMVQTIEDARGVVELKKGELAQGMYTIVAHFENGTRSTHKVLFN
ncbi:T9SS type A sorting domain-containing protein [Aureispira sp. CCB-E]|uniref:T9SS type A sorting domain-containing protein n=1 Tax=Aureispira sp. CCB-E TaxID=3051121 RepID=UPI002868937E|nr:T9SS type A sorting domain-containing protein [Aureispira sp. CCB-E]WMX16956.1 T9SS type A sorting domain-containing protein [Aureispira sp. CCB-E]